LRHPGSVSFVRRFVVPIASPVRPGGDGRSPRIRHRELHYALVPWWLVLAALAMRFRFAGAPWRLRGPQGPSNLDDDAINYYRGDEVFGDAEKLKQGLASGQGSLAAATSSGSSRDRGKLPSSPMAQSSGAELRPSSSTLKVDPHGPPQGADHPNRSSPSPPRIVVPPCTRSLRLPAPRSSLAPISRQPPAPGKGRTRPHPPCRSPRSCTPLPSYFRAARRPMGVTKVVIPIPSLRATDWKVRRHAKMTTGYGSSCPARDRSRRATSNTSNQPWARVRLFATNGTKPLRARCRITRISRATLLIFPAKTRTQPCAFIVAAECPPEFPAGKQSREGADGRARFDSSASLRPLQ